MVTFVEPAFSIPAGRQACIIYNKIKEVRAASKESYSSRCTEPRLPCPSHRRKAQSLLEQPFHIDNENLRVSQVLGRSCDHPETVLYLAYGSNLCARTFQGTRGIRPLSQVNVVVPELVMTFDLAGLPYIEPCFANTKYRHPSPTPKSTSEKTSLLPQKTPKYHKTRWKKGLVGVVYEVTMEDFAHILATEGGGAAYQDVLVSCYELHPNENTVPEFPTSAPFKAHTLYSPVLPPDTPPPVTGRRFSRPDPNHAQPSARYLKLITDGADEHTLPEEYKIYLHQLRPYTITSQRLRLGAWIFSLIWLPLISAVFMLNSVFGDDSGRAPAWLVAITGAIFRGMWMSYDGVFFRLFGDGERTHYEDEDDDYYADGDGTLPSASSKAGCDDSSEKLRGNYGEV